MTLNGHFVLKSVSGSATNELTFLAFGKTVWKIAELPTYYQQQKFSPEILVSNKVRFMWIFAGFHWRDGIKWELGHAYIIWVDGCRIRNFWETHLEGCCYNYRYDKACKSSGKTCTCLVDLIGIICMYNMIGTCNLQPIIAYRDYRPIDQ